MAVKNQVTSKTGDAPGTDLWKTEISTRSAKPRVQRKKLERIVSGFEKSASSSEIITLDISSSGLQIAKDVLALLITLVARVHLMDERILPMLERSPG